MPFLELQLSIDATLESHAEAALEELGALSVTLMDADADTPGEDAILEPGVGDTPLWRSLTVLALFDADTDRRELSQALRDAMPELAPDRVAFREVADRDWERAWMDRFKPMRFGQRLWIYPWNIEPPRDDRPRPLPSPASGGGREGVALRATHRSDDATAVVRLDPGLAFGTGTHATTALCLEWLDALDLGGRTIIDYGCGSGVLAIAALKLGAAAAVGIDNDPQALTASRVNAERNRVAARLQLFWPEAVPAATCGNVLIANILSQPLHQLAPRLATLCRPGATFALSGILAGQEVELLARYGACGFAGMHTAQRGDWIRIDGRYPGKP